MSVICAAMCRNCATYNASSTNKTGTKWHVAHAHILNLKKEEINIYNAYPPAGARARTYIWRKKGCGVNGLV